jgi:uncharacterized heparinase superfamily protein
VLREHLPDGETYLVFDAGALGPSHCPGHGHADALSFELWGKGEAMIVDPGTYQYPGGQWRDYFRSTPGHSTATVDGLDQSVFAGPFRVSDMAYAAFTEIDLTASHSMVSGSHDGYLRLADPVRHSRMITRLSPRQLSICDRFEGVEEHEILLTFRLMPATVIRHEDRALTARFSARSALNLCVSDPDQGRLEVESGWIRRTWYEKEKAPVIRYRIRDRLPLEIVTELVIL